MERIEEQARELFAQYDAIMARTAKRPLTLAEAVTADAIHEQASMLLDRVQYLTAI